MYSFITRTRRAGHLKTSIAGLLAGVGLVIAPTTASAATYVYDLVASLTGGMVKGTITTDTNSGAVAIANILAWDFTLDYGGGPVSLNSSNSAIVDGQGYRNDIVATADGLYFDFSGRPTGHLLFMGASDTNISNLFSYCSGPPGCMADYSQITLQIGTAGKSGGRSFLYTGVQQIASIAAAPGGVPEPATWALMIGGFGLTGSALRRRRALEVG